MKKLFTLITTFLMASTLWATDYTEDLVVSINGVETPAQQTTISLEKNADGTYNFSLANFSFSGMPIGDINLNNVDAVTDGDVTLLYTNQTVRLRLFGALPITLRGELRDGGSKLYASMDIDVAMLKQTVNVQFGNGGYQLANASFENWHKSLDGSQTEEPNAWHSFGSASGALASLAGSHCFISSEAHSGKASAMLKATSIFGIIANGTMTTGRMNAGSITVSDPANNAFLDMSRTDVDGNGDPFYSVMNGRPDSVAVWVKYNQGTVNANHPYATVSAAITDGTYYQDPQDKSYSNVLATAKDATIEATGNEWKRIVVPFDYVDNSIDGRAILVTISTNADAGQGSGGDSILVDDINFIYDQPVVTGITVKDQAVALNDSTTSYTVETAGAVTADDINVTTDGAHGARVMKLLKQDGDNQVATIVVLNGNLTANQVYVLTLTPTASGINGVSANGSKKVEAIYNLSGQQVSTMQHGQVYIVKQGGKAVKVIK